MRGVLRIGGFLGVRHVPRQSGACGSSCSLSVPGFCGRRRLGDGLGRTVAVTGNRRRLGIVVSLFVMNCNAAGRVTPPQQRFVPRQAARSFRAPQRRDLRRPAAPHYRRCKAPLSASSRQHPWRPVQGRRQGGGVEPPRLAATARERRHYREAR